MKGVSRAIKWARGKLRRFSGGFTPDSRIHLYTHHKVATALMSKVFRDISTYFGLKFIDAPGYNQNISNSAHIVHYWHSLVSDEIINSKHKGVHVMRDPRDVIVSGYLYHKRSSEAWCINENFELSENIVWPQVDFSQEFLSNTEKIDYINWLNGNSYQENIKSLNQNEGLIFEMEGFAGRTISDMINWKRNENIIESKFEEIIANYDDVWEGIFTHMGFSNENLKLAIEIARRHDLSRMTEDQIAKDSHISTGKITKWKDFFSQDVEKEYTERFGNCHLSLGYE